MSIENNKNLYNPLYVRDLFDEMSKTYGIVNLITSFGFTTIWRKICVKQTARSKIKAVHVVDLMSGMGEIFAVATPYLDNISKITALDISSVMCDEIEETKKKYPAIETTILREDALASSIPSGSADYLYCSFGLKTLNQEQQLQLAKEVDRILKPGGEFSFIEISVPKSSFLKIPLFFYLTFLIPALGWMFLGNPDNYRHLAVYTKKFENSKFFFKCFEQTSLEAQYFDHFFGSASGVKGRKPIL